MTWVLIRRWRPVRRGRRQCLNAGFPVLGDRHCRRLFQGAFHPPRIHDFNFLVHVQNLNPLSFKLRIPALHIVADLVRPDFALRQYPMQFGTAQFNQTWMACGAAMLPHVPLQQRVVHSS